MTFSFILNGQTYSVHTEVGDGVTRWVVQQEQQEQSIDSGDDE